MVMDSWAIPGRLSLPPFRNVSSVSSLLSVFCLYHSPATTANGQYNQGETYPEKLSQHSQTRRSIKEINVQIAY
jgi:hypothetical protein